VSAHLYHHRTKQHINHRFDPMHLRLGNSMMPARTSRHEQHRRRCTCRAFDH